MKHTEIERRYLVRAIDPDITRAPGKRIFQGYFEAAPWSSVRIRIWDGRTAKIARKSGMGLAREEEERDIDLETARFLLETSPYTLEKTRYVRDGWEVDFFHGPLTGLVIAEREMASLEELVVLPPWIQDAVEVTDSLTNSHLARLAADLGDALPQRPVRDVLPRRVPHVVLTGGPCSGKTAVMEILRREMGDVFHFVPEAASIVIAQVGVRPPGGDAVAMRGFQRTMCRVQRCFEQVSNVQALLDGKRALLLDRGVLDNAAYLPGGLVELESILRSTRADEYAAYERVICLETPPREVYEANRLNNPARTESWEAARALGDRIRAAWGGHPKFSPIANGASWEDKVEAVRRVLKSSMTGSGYSVDSPPSPPLP